ncbi:CinA family protein [Candidatus Margulisiibacteriota bacterium]
MAEDTKKVDDFFNKVLSIIGKTTGEQVADLLKKSKQTISVAESITGGLISSKLTSQPGSSEFFVGGIVCYNNRVKVMDLGVSAQLIAKESPVSASVAIAMAEGARKRFRTSIAISATGVAGPGGTMPPKPIGLTYIALSSSMNTEWKEFEFQGGRWEIREKAAQAALGLLWLHLGGKDIVSKWGK